MKRNRNIRTLPSDNLSLLKHPLPEARDENNFFGEAIGRNATNSRDCNFLSSDDSLENVLAGVRELGTGRSSSSSLSWDEDYKTEASKQLRDELERMDRILRGEEAIPDNYDRDEYEEWMELFPNLCVLGVGAGSRPANNPERYCDKVKIKEAVINHLVVKVNPDFTDDYLKISPLGGATKTPKRLSSSRSLISSQISSSRWLKDEEYASLPFIAASRVGCEAPKSILKNSVVLPPIDAVQFRSVSATPRRESKSLSALSIKPVKYSGFKHK